MSAFRWTPQSEEAVMLLARGQLTQEEIGQKVGVARRTVNTWFSNPEFRARYDEEIGLIRAEVRRVGIADKNNRLAAYNARHKWLNKLISDRADDHRAEGEPGASTGLLARDIKRVASETDEGKPTTVELVVWKFDHAPLAELRNLEKQAAIELGEWQTTDDPTGLDIRAAMKATAEKSAGYVDPDDDDASGPEGESDAENDDDDAQ